MSQSDQRFRSVFVPMLVQQRRCRIHSQPILEPTSWDWIAGPSWSRVSQLAWIVTLQLIPALFSPHLPSRGPGSFCTSSP